MVGEIVTPEGTGVMAAETVTDMTEDMTEDTTEDATNTTALIILITPASASASSS